MEKVKNIDASDMAGAIMGLPEQCLEAKRIVQKAPLPQGLGHFQNVIITGLGGSAIGGDLVKSCFEDCLQIPVIVNRDYTIPAFAGEDTLVVASSYSGNTEETLSAYNNAIKNGCKTVAITTGGKLAQIAAENGTPVITIPGGLQPRAAIGMSFVPMLYLFNRLGLLDVTDSQFNEMIDILREIREEMNPEVSEENNFAKQLASKVYGKIPVVYGSQGWKGIVAYRWKCQFNENSKNICYDNAFPELNHNEIVGTEAPANLLEQTEVINLRDADDSKAISVRVDVTSEIIRSRGAGVNDIWTRGDYRLAQMFSLIYTGDYVSYYLAILNEIDPSPVKAIKHLKSKLAEL